MNVPLYPDCSFEYIPIPDGHDLDRRTYGNRTGRNGQKLIDFFPESRRARMADESIHLDPAFSTITYGDPGRGGGRQETTFEFLLFSAHGRRAGPAKAVALELAAQLADLSCRAIGEYFGIGATAMGANRRRPTSRPEILRVIRTLSRKTAEEEIIVEAAGRTLRVHS